MARRPRERVIVYLEPATIEQLKQLGKLQDQNLSGVIRSIIAQRLQRPPRGGGPVQANFIDALEQ